MHLRDASAARKRYANILTFIALPFSGFMTDVYLPSFPSMAESLQVPEKSIQLTLTCFFLSYGISQLFVGSILDSIGRYRPVLISLVVLIATSISIAFTDDVMVINILRIVQGVATAFMVVAKRAFFVDLYEGEKRKHYLSFFTIVWSCGPIVAPFLGGYLEKLFGWQSNFYFLAIYATLVLAGELLIGGETIRNVKPFNLKKTSVLYKVMLRNKGFLYGIFVLGIAYSVTMVFNIAGPFVVEHHFGFDSVTIGYCTLILGFSWMLGGILSKRLTPLAFKPKIFTASFVQLGLIAVLMALGFSFDNLVLLVGLAFLIHICSGFIFTNFFTHNMLFFPNNAGIAGGLMGGMLYIITSFSSFLISSSGKIDTAFDMSLRYLLFGVPLLLIVMLAVNASVKKVRSKN
ncbi:MAG: MFS transporter [Cytophagaceae bacterium]|nr:MFS transporter [Cytophagaceae bacterium]